MKDFDLIVVGTGSVMDIVDALIQRDPNIRVAVVDKDEPGGICLTRGCIPSKILLYPAEIVRTIERAGQFGIDADIRKTDFKRMMDRMRSIINRDIDRIREGLSHSKNIAYFRETAEFVGPYALKVGPDIITSKMIFLCTGSRPLIPPIKGLEETGYLTSDTILRVDELPRSVAIVGGGYIAAEYGHFLSSMGSDITIVGRNQQFLPDEEPEISGLAKRELQKHIRIITNCEVRGVEKTATGAKKLLALNRENGQTLEITADEILIAAGRASNADILKPERSGIRVQGEGWIVVNEYLETSQPNIWALGDADGAYQFKHKANYEALVVFYNAVLNRRLKVDYHAVPHAIFTYPEIASVGYREREAVEKYGGDKVLVGFHRYEDTAKGEAMGIKDCFVKVIVETKTLRILGAHIIGPQASVLIHEVVNLMYTPEQSALPIINGMHIHPALNEVVERAFRSLTIPEQYHHLIEHHYQLPVR